MGHNNVFPYFWNINEQVYKNKTPNALQQYINILIVGSLSINNLTNS